MFQFVHLSSCFAVDTIEIKYVCFLYFTFFGFFWFAFECCCKADSLSLQTWLTRLKGERSVSQLSKNHAFYSGFCFFSPFHLVKGKGNKKRETKIKSKWIGKRNKNKLHWFNDNAQDELWKRWDTQSFVALSFLANFSWAKLINC